MSNMTTTSAGQTAQAVTKKNFQARRFFIKGIAVAVVSGIFYGLYSAFVTAGMAEGVWAEWYSEGTVLTAFEVIYVLGMLGCGLNDFISAIWAVGTAAIKGKFMDFARCLKSKPGVVMIVCAIIGGPIANGAYIVALQLAGPIAAPITALCPVVGTIISRIVFKQPLSPRMVLGITICLAASIMIGSQGMAVEAPDGMMLGIAIAFIAALGWGIEGCIAGYGTSLIDYEVGISIRQLTSGILTLGIFVPVLCLMAGNIRLFPHLLGAAIVSWPAILLFVISGFFAYKSFGLWYKGNGMCGTALGMVCNATYSFWVPLFCWLLLGVFMQIPGQELSLISWIAAFVMFFGILLIAVNPLDAFKKRAAEEKLTAPATKNESLLPLNYAILKYLDTVEDADVSAVIEHLHSQYSSFSAFNKKAIVEALCTAEKNEILLESRFDLDANGDLRVYYHVTADGAKLIEQYIS